MKRTKDYYYRLEKVKERLREKSAQFSENKMKIEKSRSELMQSKLILQKRSLTDLMEHIKPDLQYYTKGIENIENKTKELKRNKSNMVMEVEQTVERNRLRLIERVKNERKQIGSNTFRATKYAILTMADDFIAHPPTRTGDSDCFDCTLSHVIGSTQERMCENYFTYNGKLEAQTDSLIYEERKFDLIFVYEPDQYDNVAQASAIASIAGNYEISMGSPESFSEHLLSLVNVFYHFLGFVHSTIQLNVMKVSNSGDIKEWEGDNYEIVNDGYCNPKIYINPGLSTFPCNEGSEELRIENNNIISLDTSSTIFCNISVCNLLTIKSCYDNAFSRISLNPLIPTVALAISKRE